MIKRYVLLVMLTLAICVVCSNCTDSNERAKELYDKGLSLCNSGNQADGIVLLKEAEQSANRTDTSFMINIWSSLASTNMNSGAYKLALEYAKKAFAYAERSDSTMAKVNMLTLMSNSFAHLSMPDSARTSIERCIPLINKLPKSWRANTLNNTAKMLMDIDNDRAESLVNEAKKYGPSAYTSIMEAMLCCVKGQNELAEKLLTAAPESQEMILRCDKLRLLIYIMKASDRYKEAFDLQKQLSTLTDSTEIANNKQSLREVQADFDQRISQAESRKNMAYAVLAIVLLVVIVAGVTLYYRYKSVKIKHLLELDRKTIEAHNSRIRELEQIAAVNEKARAENEREAKRLRKEILQVENRHSGLLADGRKLYLEVLDGKPTIRWTKDSFRNFVEYYALVDPALVNHLESEYDSLTYKTKAFAIMESIFKTDDEVARMMCFSAGSVRTTRSRMDKKRIK